MKKKCIVLLMAASLVLTAIPGVVFADENNNMQSLIAVEPETVESADNPGDYDASMEEVSEGEEIADQTGADSDVITDTDGILEIVASSEETGEEDQEVLTWNGEGSGIEYGFSDRDQDEESIPELSLNLETEIYSEYGEVLYSYTPDYTSVYCLTSLSGEDTDPYVALYADRDLAESIGWDDNGKGDRDFSLEYEMCAGVTYYIGFGAASEEAFSYIVSLKEVIPDEEPAEIPVLQAGMEYEITSEQGEVLYAFMPEHAGVYHIYSTADSTYDPYVTLYADSERQEILAGDDNGQGDANFFLEYEMAEGSVCYFGFGVHEDAPFAYTVDLDEILFEEETEGQVGQQEDAEKEIASEQEEIKKKDSEKEKKSGEEKLAEENADERSVSRKAMKTTFDTAQTVSMDQDYYGSINSYESANYYKFTLNGSGALYIHGLFYMQSVYVTIYDSSRNEIWRVNPTGGNSLDPKYIEAPVHLASGTYYLGVIRDRYNGNYSFSLYFAKDVVGHNNSFATAQRIEKGENYSGKLESGEYQDVYKVYLSAGTNTVYFSSLMHQTAIYIYDEGENFIKAWDRIGSFENAEVMFTVDHNGYYYIVVTNDTDQCGDSTAYSFGVYFRDVRNSGSGFFKSIYWAANNNITTGYRDGRFGINDAITRGQVMTFLWRLAGRPNPRKNTKTFSDVPTSHAYYKAIQWGSEQGITAGYSNGKFGVNDPCTRGQIVMFIWRYFGKEYPIASNVFSDVPIGHAYYKAVNWAYQTNITEGIGNGKFGVNNTCTRGQCVTFLYRIRNWF